MVIMLKKLIWDIGGPRILGTKISAKVNNLPYCLPVIPRVILDLRARQVKMETNISSSGGGDNEGQGQRSNVTIRLVPSPAIAVQGGFIWWGNRKYTRGEIARSLNMTPGAISRIFNGKRQPSRVAMLKLAAYFGVTVETLLTQILPRMEIKNVITPGTR